jgi:hypothetical protein
MERVICRLEWCDTGTGVQVIGDSSMNNAFKDFRYKVEIGYWSIAIEVFYREVLFLNTMGKQGMFVLIKKCSFGYGEINYVGDGREQSQDMI